ncbi:hypothetical protein A33O_20520 [Nitratireductor aquibiodomus RA22]|uniref:Uncharacterized protein n=1 Tax=Nitratireductor aquibiodomus RA22 TaxID=1189611 RepID=I5BRK2_9HYPH|nr:hypothetical protein [Nitratireductor aquibiodomus]EIM72204.1 hypothetical protein A33O_20520 [Nitratireductor aquibiodomus RA22]
MPKQAQRAVLHLALAFAMALGWLLPHTAHASSPARALFSTAEIEQSAGNLHQHERAGGHTDQHNPADHAHETPTTPPGNGAELPPPVQGAAPMPPDRLNFDATYRLERPPRPIAIA